MKSISCACWLLACVAQVATWPALLAAQPPAPVVGGPPSNQQIAGWIAQLDADQFLEREAATEQLVLAGPVVIQPLLDSIQPAQSMEARVRGVFVLKQLALADDEPTREAAGLALERIVAMQLGTPSQKAAQTLDALSLLRQRRALDEMIRLGALTIPERTQQIEYVYGLEIGDGWRGTDQDLRRLRWLPNLRQVVLTGDKVRDSWFEHVSQLVELNTLTVNRAPITAAAAGHLAPLQALKLLELKYVPIGDEAVNDLAKLAAMDTMKLYGTEISPAGGERLRLALPLARIDLRAGAFLGISGDHHTLGCLISTVRPNTAASQAGLNPGDIIVTYQGERVGDFDALTALISKNRPGDKVAIQYVRNADSLAATRIRQDGDQLGITAKPHPLGCEVTQVADDSLAASIGVRPGDVVHRLGTDLVTSPDVLQRLFEQTRAGTAVGIEFSRDIDLKSAQAVLGEWE